MLFNNLLDGASWYLFRFNLAEYGLFDFCRSVAFWLTVALVLAFLIGVIVCKENRGKFMKISGIAAVCYAAALAVLFLSLTVREDGIVWQTFLPILLALVLVIAAAILFGVSKNKIVHIVAGALALAAILAALVCLGVYYSTGKPAEDNWLTNEQVQTVGLYASSALLVVVIVALAFWLDKGAEGFSTRSIAYAAVCVAMSFALSYIRIVKMPQGGSITIASLFPLMLYSYMFGTKKGVFAGMIYGMLQAVQDTYILHPAQFLLDYPVAFSAIGLAGMFAKSERMVPQLRFALGALAAGLMRFISHFFSGMFAFGAFAPEGQSPFMYSLTYQFMYVMPDIAIVIVVGVLVLSSKSFVSQIDKIRLNECKKTA